MILLDTSLASSYSRGILFANRYNTNPGFEDDYNQIYLVTKNGIKKLEKMKKSEMAVHIYDEIFKIKKEISLK